MLRGLLKAGPAPSRCSDFRTYYMAKDAEIIHTLLPNGIRQDRHGHAKATEVHYVVEGNVRVHQDGGFIDFSQGEAFAFPPDGSLHCIENVSGSAAVLLTVKFVSHGDAMDDFRHDKVNEKGVVEVMDYKPQDDQRPTLGKRERDEHSR